MAKRFIDTNLFQDSWFSELSKDGKLFFIYLITKCDHAGIIDFNPRYAEFETGIKLSNPKTMLTLSNEYGKRLLYIRDNYYFIPKFIQYQYPKGLHITVKAQKSVIDRLISFGIDLDSLETLSKGLSNSSTTVQDKDKDKDKDKDIVIDNWNLFAKKNELSKIKVLSDTRSKKLALRIKEGFDIYDIISAIESQPFLLGKNDKNWKISFDWIIDNDTNWVKIVEKKYEQSNKNGFRDTNIMSEAGQQTYKNGIEALRDI